MMMSYLTIMPSLTRTQVQLEAGQLEKLRDLASDRGTSMSALVREAVARFLTSRTGTGSEDSRQRGLAAIGAFASGDDSGAVDHDRHLTDAYSE